VKMSKTIACARSARQMLERDATLFFSRKKNDRTERRAFQKAALRSFSRN